MAVKTVGGADPPLIYARPAYGKPGRAFHLINLDTASPVYYDDNPTVTALSNVIYPLGRAGFDGQSDVYASTLNPAVSVQVMALPGHQAWDPGPVQAASAIQRSGVPPLIPGLTSAVILSKSSGTYTFLTFPAASRIWGCHTSFAVASNASYTGGTTQVYARVLTGSAITFGGPIELNIGGPQQNDSGDGDLSIGGFTVAGGDTLVLDVNNGLSMTNGVMRASAVVFYSTP